MLGDLGVTTFGDLRTDDPGDDGSVHTRYRLTVTATDVSRRRLVYFPWQYDEYGRDPDEQLVVDAVRASASIPYFFEPVSLSGPRGTSTLVDGGLVSNYPISMFDRTDGRPARWPTIGIRLSTPPSDTADVHRVRGAGAARRLARADRDRGVPGRPRPGPLQRGAQRRGRHVVGQRDRLRHHRRPGAALLTAAGRTAATAFLDLDYDAWRTKCRPADPAGPATAQPAEAGSSTRRDGSSAIGASRSRPCGSRAGSARRSRLIAATRTL